MLNTVEIQAAIQVGKVKHTFTFESVSHLETWVQKLGWSTYQAGGMADFVLLSAGEEAEAFGIVQHHRTKYNTEKA
tara:strand:+ start:2108 stop:2335 length:228 start_codon:yes stop_codon:yes gene_type:complete